MDGFGPITPQQNQMSSRSWSDYFIKSQLEKKIETLFNYFSERMRDRRLPADLTIADVRHRSVYKPVNQASEGRG